MSENRIEFYEDFIYSEGPSAESKLISLADSGDVDAMYVLGIALYDGDLPPRRTQRAMEYLSQAAAVGHIKATHDLACFHYYGYNLPESFRDLQRAIELFKIGAEKGYIPSLLFLSALYRDGEGLPKSEERAKELYSIALARGYVPET